MTPLKPSGLCVVLVQLCPCDAFREEVGAVRPIVGRVTECLLENMLMDPSAGIATCTTDDLGGGTDYGKDGGAGGDAFPSTCRPEMLVTFLVRSYSTSATV